VNCTAKVPQDLTVSDVHLCAIVGNLMDNAIEACEKMKKETPDAERFMRVYIGLFKSQLYISVINSTKERKRRRVSELVTSKLGEHGFGLRRIDKITEKYDGYVNRKNEPGVFATEVMLPL
jgi:sensor histidine kinase regulating citrate/malate metabolism